MARVLCLKESGLTDEDRHRSMILHCKKKLTFALQLLKGNSVFLFISQWDKYEAIRFQLRNLDWKLMDFSFAVASPVCEHLIQSHWEEKGSWNLLRIFCCHWRRRNENIDVELRAARVDVFHDKCHATSEKLQDRASLEMCRLLIEN